jgi:hypothetical protein
MGNDCSRLKKNGVNMMRMIFPLLFLLMPQCVLNPKKGADAEAVLDYYQSQKAGAESCYSRISKNQNHKITGEVALSWKVTLQGKPQEIKVERSTVSQPELESCLIEHLSGLEFPKQARFHPARVEHVWNFGKN